MRRQYGTLGETRNTMNTRNDNNGRISLTNSDYNTNNNRNNDFLMLPEEEEHIENNFSEKEKAQQEWYHILANRLRYTQGYILFYMFVLILGVIVLVWSMYDFIKVENQRRSGGGSGGKNDESESKRHPALLALDVILVICICIEVLIRYLATSENFFNRCSNFSDVALSFLCVIGLFLDFSVPLKNDNGISFLMFLNTALLCVRGLWVLIRVIKIMMDRRKAQALADLEQNQIIFEDDGGDMQQSYREFGNYVES